MEVRGIEKGFCLTRKISCLIFLGPFTDNAHIMQGAKISYFAIELISILYFLKVFYYEDKILLILLKENRVLTGTFLRVFILGAVHIENLQKEKGGLEHI